MEQINKIKAKFTENKEAIKEAGFYLLVLLAKISFFIASLINLSFGISLLTKYTTLFILYNIAYYGFACVIIAIFAPIVFIYIVEAALTIKDKIYKPSE